MPCVKPWGRAKADLGLPENAATGRTYSGINILILWGAVIERGFACQNWMTFRQALSLGGNVRKGERGTTIVHADRFILKDEKERAKADGDEPQAVPFLERFTVFNVSQCDGLPEDLQATAEPLPEREIIPQAEALIRTSGADFRIGGERAFYTLHRRLHSGSAAAGHLRADRLLPHLLSHLAIGPDTRAGLLVTCPARSARRPMPARNWSPPPSSAPRSAPSRPYAMPTISAHG